jgi:hypothetical protein
MRSGLISAGAASKLAVLKGTKVQASKMASFDGKSKDEGAGKSKGDAIARTRHIEAPSTQKDRARSKPSSGAQAKGSQIPRRAQINTFPGKQKVAFPAGTGDKRSPKAASDNTRMKGGPKPKSGGPYGGPSSRAAG